MDIRRAKPDDLAALVPLFDDYRQFYGFASDISGASAFLKERFDNGDSVIFLAEAHGQGLGFTQLYPSFSSGRMQRIYILNDLFVAPAARGQGAGKQLLEAARAFGEAQGAAKLTLSTAIGNTAAQSLYQAQAWVREDDYWTYDLRLRM